MAPKIEDGLARRGRDWQVGPLSAAAGRPERDRTMSLRFLVQRILGIGVFETGSGTTLARSARLIDTGRSGGSASTSAAIRASRANCWCLRMVEKLLSAIGASSVRDTHMVGRVD